MASQEEDNKLECISNVNKEQERYFLNVYKKHECILNNKNESFENKVGSLIDVWKSIAELNLSQFDIRHVIQIMDWAKLHALNIVLTAEWNAFKATCQARLLQEIEKAQNELLKLNSGFATRCKKLADVVKNPWEDSVLMNLMKTKDAKIGPEEIEFFCVETAYVVSVRLKKLCESQCEDLALNLVTAFMNCNKLSKTQNFNLNATETQMWFIFDIYIALLYKFQDKQKIVVLLKELTFEEGLQLVKRFAKKRIKISKIWKNCHKVAVLATQMYISQAVVKYTEEHKIVLESYLEVYLSLCNTETLLQDFTTSIRRISNLADAAGLYIFCDVIQRKAGTTLKPLIIEMYIRALTTDMNELERQKDANEKEKVEATTSRLAEAFCNLADFLGEHVKVARECVLTAFSLEPTKDRLKYIETLASRSGYQVLDTGQEWKCKLHPPVLPSDDLAWICPECGDWMCKPQLNIPLKINMALNEALQNSVLGISESLCDDLVVCLSNPRYQILSWFLPWDDLHRLCIMYLQDPQTTKNFITELKFVDIDYSIFKGIKREPLDELAGIERGYEQYLDQDFVSDEETSSVSGDSMSQDSRPYSLGSDGAGEGPCLPLLLSQPKSDPNTLKSLRMFRPNLKRIRTNDKDHGIPEKLLKSESGSSSFKDPSRAAVKKTHTYINGVSKTHESHSKNVKVATLPPLGGQVANNIIRSIQVLLQPLKSSQIPKHQADLIMKLQANPVAKTREDTVPKPQANLVLKPQEDPVSEPQEDLVPEPQEEPVPETLEDPVSEPQEDLVPEPQEESVPEPQEEPVPELQIVLDTKFQEDPVPKPQEDPDPKPLRVKGTITEATKRKIMLKLLGEPLPAGFRENQRCRLGELSSHQMKPKKHTKTSTNINKGLRSTQTTIQAETKPHTMTSSMFNQVNPTNSVNQHSPLNLTQPPSDSCPPLAFYQPYTPSSDHRNPHDDRTDKTRKVDLPSDRYKSNGTELAALLSSREEDLETVHQGLNLSLKKKETTSTSTQGPAPNLGRTSSKSSSSFRKHCPLLEQLMTSTVSKAPSPCLENTPQIPPYQDRSQRFPSLEILEPTPYLDGTQPCLSLERLPSATTYLDPIRFTPDQSQHQPLAYSENFHPTSWLTTEPIQETRSQNLPPHYWEILLLHSTANNSTPNQSQNQVGPVLANLQPLPYEMAVEPCLEDIPDELAPLAQSILTQLALMADDGLTSSLMRFPDLVESPPPMSCLEETEFTPGQLQYQSPPCPENRLVTYYMEPTVNQLQIQSPPYSENLSPIPDQYQDRSPPYLENHLETSCESPPNQLQIQSLSNSENLLMSCLEETEYTTDEVANQSPPYLENHLEMSRMEATESIPNQLQIQPPRSSENLLLMSCLEETESTPDHVQNQSPPRRENNLETPCMEATEPIPNQLQIQTPPSLESLKATESTPDQLQNQSPLYLENYSETSSVEASKSTPNQLQIQQPPSTENVLTKSCLKETESTPNRVQNQPPPCLKTSCVQTTESSPNQLQTQPSPRSENVPVIPCLESTESTLNQLRPTTSKVHPPPSLENLRLTSCLEATKSKLVQNQPSSSPKDRLEMLATESTPNQLQIQPLSSSKNLLLTSCLEATESTPVQAPNQPPLCLENRLMTSCVEATESIPSQLQIQPPPNSENLLLMSCLEATKSTLDQVENQPPCPEKRLVTPCVEKTKSPPNQVQTQPAACPENLVVMSCLEKTVSTPKQNQPPQENQVQIQNHLESTLSTPKQVQNQPLQENHLVTSHVEATVSTPKMQNQPPQENHPGNSRVEATVSTPKQVQNQNHLEMSQVGAKVSTPKQVQNQNHLEMPRVKSTLSTPKQIQNQPPQENHLVTPRVEVTVSTPKQVQNQNHLEMSHVEAKVSIPKQVQNQKHLEMPCLKSTLSTPKQIQNQPPQENHPVTSRVASTLSTPKQVKNQPPQENHPVTSCVKETVSTPKQLQNQNHLEMSHVEAKVSTQKQVKNRNHSETSRLESILSTPKQVQSRPPQENHLVTPHMEVTVSTSKQVQNQNHLGMSQVEAKQSIPKQMQNQNHLEMPRVKSTLSTPKQVQNQPPKENHLVISRVEETASTPKRVQNQNHLELSHVEAKVCTPKQVKNQNHLETSRMESTLSTPKQVQNQPPKENHLVTSRVEETASTPKQVQNQNHLELSHVEAKVCTPKQVKNQNHLETSRMESTLSTPKQEQNQPPKENHLVTSRVEETASTPKQVQNQNHLELSHVEAKVCTPKQVKNQNHLEALSTPKQVQNQPPKENHRVTSHMEVTASTPKQVQNQNHLKMSRLEATVSTLKQVQNQSLQKNHPMNSRVEATVSAPKQVQNQNHLKTSCGEATVSTPKQVQNQLPPHQQNDPVTPHAKATVSTPNQVQNQPPPCPDNRPGTSREKTTVSTPKQVQNQPPSCRENHGVTSRVESTVSTPKQVQTQNHLKTSRVESTLSTPNQVQNQAPPSQQNHRVASRAEATVSTPNQVQNQAPPSQQNHRVDSRAEATVSTPNQVQNRAPPSQQNHRVDSRAEATVSTPNQVQNRAPPSQQNHRVASRAEATVSIPNQVRNQAPPCQQNHRVTSRAEATASTPNQVQNQAPPCQHNHRVTSRAEATVSTQQQVQNQNHLKASRVEATVSTSNQLQNQAPPCRQNRQVTPRVESTVSTQNRVQSHSPLCRHNHQVTSRVEAAVPTPSQVQNQAPPCRQNRQAMPRVEATVSTPNQMQNQPHRCRQNHPVTPRVEAAVSTPNQMQNVPPRQNHPVTPRVEAAVSTPNQMQNVPPRQNHPVTPRVEAAVSTPNQMQNVPPRQNHPVTPRVEATGSAPNRLQNRLPPRSENLMLMARVAARQPSLNRFSNQRPLPHCSRHPPPRSATRPTGSLQDMTISQGETARSRTDTGSEPPRQRRRLTSPPCSPSSVTSSTTDWPTPPIPSRSPHSYGEASPTSNHERSPPRAVSLSEIQFAIVSSTDQILGVRRISPCPSPELATSSSGNTASCSRRSVRENRPPSLPTNERMEVVTEETERPERVHNEGGRQQGVGENRENVRENRAVEENRGVEGNRQGVDENRNVGDNRGVEENRGGVNENREDVNENRGVEENREGVNENRAVKENREGVNENRGVEENREGVNENRGVEENREGVNENRGVEANRESVNENRGVEENREGVNENQGVENNREGVNENRGVEENREGVNENRGVEENREGVNENRGVEENREGVVENQGVEKNQESVNENRGGVDENQEGVDKNPEDIGKNPNSIECNNAGVSEREGEVQTEQASCSRTKRTRTNCLGVIDDGIFSDPIDEEMEEVFYFTDHDYSSFVKDDVRTFSDDNLPKNFNLTENLRTYAKRPKRDLPLPLDHKDCVKPPPGDENLEVCKNVNSSISIKKIHSTVQKLEANCRELRVILCRLPAAVTGGRCSKKKCDRGRTPPRGARRRRSSDKSENKVDKAPSRVQNHKLSPLLDINPRVVSKENSKSCCDDVIKPKSVEEFMVPRVLLERINVDKKKYARSVLANVPGLNDYQMMRPTNVNHIVNVVQVSGGRPSQNVPIQATQTSTQVSPHIQRIGQPRVAEQKPENSSSAPATATTTAAPAATTAPTKTPTTQPSTLINILSQQIIRPVTTQSNTVRRQAPLINILSQQIIRPSQTPKAASNSNITTTENSQVKPAATTDQPPNNQTKATTANAAIKIATPTTTAAGSTILQFICKSTLPKFQQAFGKTVYQNTADSPIQAATAVESANVVTEAKKEITKAVPVNVQPIQGSVIYSRQVPVGQTISLIPPGGTTRQVFRIATSNPEQISLVKDTVIHSKMSALLAAALQARPKSSEGQSNSEEKVTLARPALVQNARIVKPVQLQIPPNVTRTAPQTNLSSTTLEQLREFDMVYKQVKERSSSTAPAEPQESQEAAPQRISVTYVNQLQKYTQLSPVVVVSTYNNLQPAASPALSVTSQGSSSPCVTPAPTLPKIATKTSKGKTLKSTTNNTAAKAAPIPKPQQKPQEDEHTTQRIFDILAEYAEQLRNSPDLNNKPAPRRRSNPPTNPSQNSKRKKSSSGSKKTSQSSNTVEIDADDITMGSEDSSGGGIVQLSVTDDEQSQAATVTTPESTENSSPSSSRPLILAEGGACGNQSRNLIIADSSVGEALKMPNTAVIVPGSYIMPVSMVKGGQQIAVVSGGSKILATVPARSGQNMLLFQSFMNQNRKGSISAVKYSTIQPIAGISSQSLAGVSAQPPVILPSSSVATAMALGQPLTLKKFNDDRDGNELLLAISPPKEDSKNSSDVPQPDSSTSVSSDSNDVKIEEGGAPQSDSSNEKIYQTYQKSVITNSVATSVIATTSTTCIKEAEENHSQNVINMNMSDNIKVDPKQPNERMQSVLVTACSSNGPMLSHTTPRYKKAAVGGGDPTKPNTNHDLPSKGEEYLHNGNKVKAGSNETRRGAAAYYVNRARKTGHDKTDSELQKQAALERELRLQKSLSEECEDLGVDEPSTSDLFPEADLLFDSNHSPSYDQSSQDLKRAAQTHDLKEEVKAAMNLFSDDETSSSLRTDLFEYVEYQTVETALDYQARQLMNGNASSNESGSSGAEDNTLLAKCPTMAEVTLNSPISPETFVETSPNKYKFKYTNRKKGERTKQGEVVSSTGEARVECEDENFKVVHVAIAKAGEKCELHCDEDTSGRGARRSVRKLCSCCNGSQDGGARKRHQPPAHVPHKKAFLAKKR